MAIIKYGMDNLLAALKPGLSSLVMNAFKDRLEQKMQNAVDEVFKEMEKELPNQIEVKLRSVLNPEMQGTEVRVIIDLNKN